MTPDQFDTAASRTQLQAPSLAAARLVLVDGHGHAEAANRTGTKREDVRKWCARVVQEHRGILGCPRAWRCLTVCVPPDVATQIEKMARIAQRERED